MDHTVRPFAATFTSALEGGQIVPHFQPIVSLRMSTVVGLEVLARWWDPNHGAIAPDRFIPQAERDGLLDGLTDRLMRTAFAAAANWPSHLFLGFNVSPTQLHNSALPERIAAAAADHDFPLTRVHIEITESAIIADLGRAEAMLDRLIGMGCIIAMDDFGTRYSSLTWLSRLPFSKIKIDSGFIGSMLDRQESRKIVKAVIALGNSLGRAVVAEGVEKAPEAELLTRLGCPLAQGHLFGAPAPASEIPALLARSNAVARHEAVEAEHDHASVEQRSYQISALYRSDDTSIAFIGTDGQIHAASEAFARLLGQRSAELIGRHIWQVARVPRVRIDELRAIATMGSPFPLWETRMPGGGTALVVIHRVHDEIDNLVGYSVLAVDVSQRTAVETPCRDGVGDQIVDRPGSRLNWTLDANGVVTQMDEWEWGTPIIEGTMGMEWIKAQPAEDKRRILTAWLHSLSSGERFDEELRIRMPSGRYRWFRSSMTPEFGADGSTIVGWNGQTEMIQHLKEAEVALRAVADIQLDDVRPLIWVMSPTGRLISMSRQWHELCAGPPDEITSRSVMRYIHPDHRDAARAHWRHSMRTGDNLDIDYPVTFPGSRPQWMRCLALPRRNDRGDVVAWYGSLTPTEHTMLGADCTA